MIKVWLLVVWFNASGNYVYLPTTITEFTVKQECVTALAELKLTQRRTEGVCIEKTRAPLSWREQPR